MDFILSNNLSGILIGISAFLIIGYFHPDVIKADYYFGTSCWWIFLLIGIAAIIGSVLLNNVIYSALSGVFGFSSLWTILELFQQKKRVEKGWFPKNQKKE